MTTETNLRDVPTNKQVAAVVATFERNVVDVAHVGQTSDRTRSAKPLMIAGGIALLSGLGLFAYEVAQPWDEYTAASAEAAMAHAEAPEMPGLGTGALGAGLALLGLVPFVIGGMRLRDEPLEAYSIGEGPETRLTLDGAGLPDASGMDLVRRSGDSYILSFTRDMEGDIRVGDSRISLQDLVASGRSREVDGAFRYAMPSGARARVYRGDVGFHVNLVEPGNVTAGRGEVDWSFVGFVGGAATLGLTAFALMSAMPDAAFSISMGDEDGEAAYARYFHQADEDLSEPDEPTEVTEPSEETGEAGGKTQGAKAAGATGKAGDKSSKVSDKAMAVAGPKDATKSMARYFDPDMAARSAGILGILQSEAGHFLASDTGTFAIGNDDRDAWGNMTGTELGAANGNGAWGLVGVGHHGGGDANGVLGLGTTGLIGGPGVGSGDGTLIGPGKSPGFNDRKAKVPVARVEKGKYVGQIDKDMVRRVVRAHINEVRSCYNKGLSKNPNLSGRVTVKFSISANGKVGSAFAEKSTVADKAVARCIAKAVKRWKFPRPRNGTVIVTYPFRLTAG